MCQFSNPCLCTRIVTIPLVNNKTRYTLVSNASQYLMQTVKLRHCKMEVSTKYSKTFHYHYLAKYACMFHDFAK